MRICLTLAVILLTFLLSGCRHSGGGSRQSETAGCPDSISEMSPAYALGFSVSERADGVRLVTMRHPADTNAVPQHFALIPKGTEPTDIPDGYTAIHVPVERVVCMTMTQLGAFATLDSYDKVVATSNTQRTRNPEWLRRLDDGRVSRIGMEGNFDKEIILACDPDVIFISPHRRGGYDGLKNLGIPLIHFWAFSETTPLGLSEWIKITGMFIGKEQKAIEVFQGIEKRYNGLKALAAGATDRPSVMSGEMRGGTWYVPGGNSFYGRLFRDAGARYFMESDTGTDATLMEFEQVYSKGCDADFWRVMNAYHGEFSYEVLEASDARYADFKAFRNRKVIYCNLEEVPLYENLPLTPDILLADMIKAFHPDLLPNHKPVYYHLLQ